MIFVFSYNRPEMLLQTLIHLRNFNQRVVVIDDGSDYDYTEHAELCEYIRTPHMGKSEWWQNWVLALDIAKKSGEKFFVFMPDDFENLDYDRIVEFNKALPNLHTCNLINCGRTNHWGNNYYVVNEELIHSDFNDCGFFCNFEVLRKLKFTMFVTNSETSSGVGKQLTTRLRKSGIPMYSPVRSFAYHGDHESVMHPEERKVNPIISK